jgi:hypothetical protein
MELIRAGVPQIWARDGGEEGGVDLVNGLSGLDVVWRMKGSW